MPSPGRGYAGWRGARVAWSRCVVVRAPCEAAPLPEHRRVSPWSGEVIHQAMPARRPPQAKRERFSVLTRLEDTLKEQLAAEAARAPPLSDQEKLAKTMELRLQVCGLTAHPPANDDARGASPVRHPLV